MKNRKPFVFLLGANHKTAPVELREKLFVTADELGLVLPEIKQRHDLLELVVLSTCNRFELFGVSRQPLQRADILQAFLEIQKTNTENHQLAKEQLSDALYLLAEDEAVAHVYKVAASLDSLVLGETQITGQFKDALALAQKAGTIGPMIGRLGQEALAAAKKVRTQTAIGKRHVSINHAAIELAQKIFGDLSEHRFLVIGAGDMSQVAAKYIMSYGPKALYIANRTPEKAAAIIDEIGFGKAYHIDELPNLLLEIDIVLSCTSAPHVILDAATVKRAHAARRSRPLFLLDMAMPRDIDPDCGKLDDVYLFDIDDLKQVVGANYEERRKAAEEAQEIIDRSVNIFQNWLDTQSVKPVLAGFRAYLDDLIEREMAKTLAREQFRDLSEQQTASIKALFTAVATKISADASRRVTSPPEGYYGEQLAEALSLLFPTPVKIVSSEPSADSPLEPQPRQAGVKKP